MSAALRALDGGGKASPRHFLEIMDHEPAVLRRMLDLAEKAKRGFTGLLALAMRVRGRCVFMRDVVARPERPRR